jgi:tetratricopeptide (TPR) repeat protein
MVRDYIEEQVAWVRKDPRDGERHAVLGLVYAANGLWKEARLAFANARRLMPREPLAWLYEAVSAQEAGAPEEALRLFQELVNRFPDFPHGYYRLGEALMRAGDAEQAAVSFAALTNLAPAEWRGYAGLGQANLQRGDLTNAARLLELATRIDPSARSAYHLLGQAYQRLGRTNEAQRALRLGLDATVHPMTDAWAQMAPRHMRRLQDLVQMAQEYLEANLPQLGVATLERAMPYYSNNVTVLANLGILYTQTGLPQQAQRLLERALELDPDYVPGYLGLSAAQVAQAANDAALTNALKAVALAPRNVQPYLAQANALLALGRDGAALSALEEASARDPKNAQILMDMGNISLMNLGRVEDALEYYQRGMKLDPFFLPIQVCLTDLNISLGRTNEAQALLDGLTQAAPREPAVQALAKRLRQTITNAPPAGPVPIRSPDSAPANTAPSNGD